MNQFIQIPIILLLVTSAQGGWFNHDVENERQRRLEAENRSQQVEAKLEEQRTRTDHWELATGGLAVACVVLLGVGAALGAKARHHEQ